MIPHNRLSIDDEPKFVVQTVERGCWSQGPVVSVLEEILKQICRVKYAVAVNSGSTALILALKAVGASDSRVAIPEYCCVGVANAVLAVRGYPVGCRIDSSSLNMDIAYVPKNVAAVITVNTFGMPAEIPRIGVPVIEDCVHGLGWAGMGRRTEVAITSFKAMKLISSGGGGAVLTNDKRIAELVQDWRSYDGKTPSYDRMNGEMSDVHATMAIVQLNKLRRMIAQREFASMFYQDRLMGLGRVSLPDRYQNRIWYRYVIATDRKARQVEEIMRSMGVDAKRPVDPWQITDEVTRWASEHLLSLPLYPGITFKEQEQVCRVLERAIA